MPKKKREHLAFHIPADLRRRAEAVIAKVRGGTPPKDLSSELIELIVDLTHTGLHAYFIVPLERVEVGSLALGTARLGVATADKSLPTIVRRVLGMMNDDQLRGIVEALDEMLM